MISQKCYKIICVQFIIFILFINLSLGQEVYREIELGETKIKTSASISEEGPYYRLSFSDYNKLELEYSDGQSFNFEELLPIIDNGKESIPEISLDSGGVVIGAKFKTGKSGKYIFGNYQTDLPKGAIVIFERGHLEILMPNGEIISSPENVEGIKDVIKEFNLIVPEKNKAIFGDYEVGRNSEDLILKFDAKVGAFYFDQNGYTKLDGVTAYNKDNARTYLLDENSFDLEIHDRFDSFEYEGRFKHYIWKHIYDSPLKKDIDGTGFFMKKGSIFVSNKGNKKSNIFYLNGPNDLGLIMEEKDSFAFRLEGGNKNNFISIHDRTDQERIPLTQVNGDLVIQENGMLVKFKDSLAYETNQKRMIKSNVPREETTMTPMELYSVYESEPGEYELHLRESWNPLSYKWKRGNKPLEGIKGMIGESLIISNDGYMVYTSDSKYGDKFAKAITGDYHDAKSEIDKYYINEYRTEDEKETYQRAISAMLPKFVSNSLYMNYPSIEAFEKMYGLKINFNAADLWNTKNMGEGVMNEQDMRILFDSFAMVDEWFIEQADIQSIDIQRPYKETSLGAWDPDERRIILVPDNTGLSSNTILHELGHALMDSQFEYPNWFRIEPKHALATTDYFLQGAVRAGPHTRPDYASRFHDEVVSTLMEFLTQPASYWENFGGDKTYNFEKRMMAPKIMFLEKSLGLDKRISRRILYNLGTIKNINEKVDWDKLVKDRRKAENEKIAAERWSWLK